MLMSIWKLCNFARQQNLHCCHFGSRSHCWLPTHRPPGHPGLQHSGWPPIRNPTSDDRVDTFLGSCLKVTRWKAWWIFVKLTPTRYDITSWDSWGNHQSCWVRAADSKSHQNLSQSARIPQSLGLFQPNFPLPVTFPQKNGKVSILRYSNLAGWKISYKWRFPAAGESSQNFDSFVQGRSPCLKPDNQTLQWNMRWFS